MSETCIKPVLDQNKFKINFTIVEFCYISTMHFPPFTATVYKFYISDSFDFGFPNMPWYHFELFCPVIIFSRKLPVHTINTMYDAWK